jgi:hypothetical protein
MTDCMADAVTLASPATGDWRPDAVMRHGMASGHCDTGMPIETAKCRMTPMSIVPMEAWSCRRDVGKSSVAGRSALNVRVVNRQNGTQPRSDQGLHALRHDVIARQRDSSSLHVR